MLNENLKIKFPFAYDYFSKMLELSKNGVKKFPQALIFEGADTINQYLFALELARVLNCKNNGEIDCNCINCNWIRNLSHPAIKNISQIHSKPDDDTSTTVISVKQAKQIEKELILSSDYYRFYIFFSSKPSQNFIEDFEKLNYKNEIDFTIDPIKHSTFNPTTPNALLKSIEEPPINTCFIFLTTSRDEILQTIVSRCQTFKLSKGSEKINYDNIIQYFSQYPNITYTNSISISENILKMIKENNSSLDIELNKILIYLKDLLIQNPDMYLKIKKDIEIINLALKQTNASMQDKIILDTMLYKIARGY